MVAIEKDLWGDFTLEDIEISPLSLLNHQASLLKEKTNDFMRGEVISRSFTPSEAKKERMIHLFNVVVPGLKNRRVELFRAVHDVNTVYPIELVMNVEPKVVATSANFEEFRQKLTLFLADPNVKAKLYELSVELKSKGKAKSLN